MKLQEIVIVDARPDIAGVQIGISGPYNNNNNNYYYLNLFVLEHEDL